MYTMSLCLCEALVSPKTTHTHSASHRHSQTLYNVLFHNVCVKHSLYPLVQHTHTQLILYSSQRTGRWFLIQPVLRLHEQTSTAVNTAWGHRERNQKILNQTNMLLCLTWGWRHRVHAVIHANLHLRFLYLHVKLLKNILTKKFMRSFKPIS